MLGPLRLQDAKRLVQLLGGHAVFGIARIVHDAVANFEQAARVIAAADGFGNMADRLLEKIDMRDVVEVDDGAQLVGKHVIGRGRFVRGEHDVVAAYAASVGKHELGIRRAIAAAAVFLQDFDKERIRGCLHREVFPIALVPCERIAQGFHVPPDAHLVVQMKRRGELLGDGLELLFGGKRPFLHEGAPFLFCDSRRFGASGTAHATGECERHE